jgi:MFS transporter, DHA2 family, multidrug resistance protein
MDGLPKPERTWAFITIALALTMAVLDGSIVNVALPVSSRSSPPFCPLPLSAILLGTSVSTGVGWPCSRSARWDACYPARAHS